MDASAVGLQSAPETLARGSVLRDTYKITDVLSRSALGVTYLAQDLRTENLSAVTEYSPQALAARTSTGLAALPGYEAAYSQQLQRFLGESQSLARFQHPNIAAVTDLFTAGGTAYRVVNYEQGRTLTSWLAGLDSPPNQLEIDLLFGPLCDALTLMHAHGEIHGDIMPDHIRIRYDGTPVLLRFAGGHVSDAGGAASACHPAYAPPEQYASDRAATGPWTDIYMLAATVYRTITGQPPPEATSRLNADRYLPAARAAAPGYRQALLAAVDWALRTPPRERPQSVQAWRQMLFQEDPVANASTGGVAPPTSVPISAPPTAGTAHTTAIPLTWHQPLGFVGLSILNFLMRIPTLGLYAFWGRTEVRKRIWSGIRLDGEPLQYTGTGKELMIGFFIIFGAILVPYLLLTLGVVAALGQGALPIYQLISYAGFLLLYGIGTYRAQRYRLSRTRWRGIRGSLTGSSWSYGWTAWWTLPLLVLTLGWLSPWRATRLQSMLVGDMKFGDQPFRFTATSSGLYGRYAATWIGTIIVVISAFAAIGLMVRGVMGDISPANATEAMKAKVGFATMGILGLAYILYTVANAWYRAGMLNHFARHTHIDNATFYGTATTGGVLWVTVSNAILSLGTLGLLTPVAQARWTRYLVEHMRLNGTVSLAAINQGADQGIRHGEGLAQAFDLDAF